MFQKRKVYSLSDACVNTKSAENILSVSDLKPSDETRRNTKLRMNFKPFLGIFYTCLTSVFITLSSVFVKQLSYISPGQLSLVRNTGVWVGCFPIAVYAVKDVFGRKDDRLMLVVRGFLGATALYLNLTAFRYLPLAEAAIIMSTMPAVITVMARIYLKEPCGLVQGFALSITLCGVLLSIRLPELLEKSNNNGFDSTYMFGVLSAVGCVLIFSVSFVALRKMKNIHFSVSLIYTGFIGMLENGTINLTTSYFVEARCGSDQVLVILIGVFGFIGHCAMTLAIQAEAVGIVSVMKASMDIVVAMIFQVIFFHVNPDLYNVAGACLVIISVSIIGFRKWLVALPEESTAKKRFRYVLM